MSYECRFRCGCTNVRPGSGPGKLSLCPQPFQEHFMKAWEASERHDYKSFDDSISNTIRESVDSLCRAGIQKATEVHEPLDVFHVLEWGNSVYAMTLMAFCAVHGQMKMVQLLLDQGARIFTGCQKCGSPLSQMMVHCLVRNVKVDTSMVQYLIEKEAPLRREIDLELDGQYARHGTSWSLLDLSLTMTAVNGVEVAKVLVTASNESGKVDYISGGAPGGDSLRIVPMFQEYWFHGTNHYIRWLCKEHILPNQERKDFVDRVLMCITAMWRNVGFQSWIYKQRIPSHAILTSQHQEITTLLVKKGKEQGENFLSRRNFSGKTALHMAAESGDLESVKILLHLEADVTACDHSNLNPFMLALEKGHKKVAKFMLENSKDTNPDRLHHVRKTIEWAIDKDITTFFQLLREVTPGILVMPITDAGDNTIVHLVAAAGNTEMFEAILENLWSKNNMEKVLQCRNTEGKTALQLAVERECIDILKAVEKRFDTLGPNSRRQSIATLQEKWQSEVIPLLFSHASSCGSLTAVKHFIAMSLTSDAENLKLPLLRAAANGHTKCVTLLLEEKASVLERDETGKNCLMLAIQNHHKQTALAILKDEKQGLDALKCVVKEKKRETTPLRLLIKEMPELAEYVLNKGITADEPAKSVVYDFQLLDEVPLEGGSEDNEAPVSSPRHNKAKARHTTEEIEMQLTNIDDDVEEKATDGQDDKPKCSSDHALKWMIDCKRLELLQHPLVKEYLFQKFWLVAFLLYLGYLLLYCVFLILLTSFALVSPRPGPDSETCPDGNPNITTNGTDCAGQSGVERTFLAVAAGLVLFLCCLLLFIEGVQLYKRGFKHYFYELDNYFQVAVFIVAIIFVAPGFANDCWCAYNWQWQIGALALCLGWFNLIILLKVIPWTAIPIIMFINICLTFLKYLFLPFLLLMAFALPFYMIFVRTASASEVIGAPALVSFTSPAHAIAKTMAQIVGEIDFENIFNEGDLLYNPMTYILFAIFLVTMPILFINLLIGLAVGDIKDELEIATYTKIELQVDFILERQKFLPEIYNRKAQCNKSVYVLAPKRCCGKHHFKRFLAQRLGLEYKKHSKEVMDKNKAIENEVLKGISDVESENILQLKEEMKALAKKGSFDSEAVREALQQESEEILQLKEEIKSLTMKEISDNDAVIAVLRQQSEEILQVLKALTEKVEALGKDRTRTTT